MGTKAQERRVRLSQERTRVRLRERATELDAAEHTLERERQQARAERRDLLALLEVWCEQFAPDLWDPKLPLPDLVESCLLASRARGTQRTPAPKAAVSAAPLLAPAPSPAPSPAPAPGPVPAPRPRPLRPTPVPAPVHRVLVVRAELRGQGGYRWTCTCGQRGSLEISDDTALVLGARHADGYDPQGVDMRSQRRI